MWCAAAGIHHRLGGESTSHLMLSLIRAGVSSNFGVDAGEVSDGLSAIGVAGLLLCRARIGAAIHQVMGVPTAEPPPEYEQCSRVDPTTFSDYRGVAWAIYVCLGA